MRAEIVAGSLEKELALAKGLKPEWAAIRRRGHLRASRRGRRHDTRTAPLRPKEGLSGPPPDLNGRKTIAAPKVKEFCPLCGVDLW